MKYFFGGVFISKETLDEAGINYPIKLEYYKNINEDELFEVNKARYGISVVKTEYEKEKVKTEEKEIKYLTNDERKTEYLLEILKENCVTPIGLKDVVYDFFQKGLQII